MNKEKNTNNIAVYTIDNCLFLHIKLIILKIKKAIMHAVKDTTMMTPNIPNVSYKKLNSRATGHCCTIMSKFVWKVSISFVIKPKFWTTLPLDIKNHKSLLGEHNAIAVAMMWI